MNTKDIDKHSAYLERLKRSHIRCHRKLFSNLAATVENGVESSPLQFLSEMESFVFGNDEAKSEDTVRMIMRYLIFFLTFLIR